jgi:hypothetical protein
VVIVTTYQFTCAVRIIETGELMPIAGLVTPPVKCDTPTEAIRHPETVAYCNENKCVVYEIVGR